MEKKPAFNFGQPIEKPLPSKGFKEEKSVNRQMENPKGNAVIPTEDDLEGMGKKEGNYPTFKFIPGKMEKIERMKIRNFIQTDILTLYEECASRNFEGEIRIKGKMVIANEKQERYNQILEEEINKVPNGNETIVFRWLPYSPTFSRIEYIYFNP